MIDEIVIIFSRYAASHGYLIAFFASLLENSIFLGAFVPGEVITILSGFYAGQQILSYPLVIALILTGSVIGDNIGFLLGRYKGKKWLTKIGPFFGYRKEKIERAEEFWKDHGDKAIFVGRFIAFARTFVPFLAGTSKIKHRRFFIFDFLGATLHSVIMVTLGYFFGERWGTISATFGTIGIILFVGLSIIVYRYLVRKGVEKIED
ncbi:DedA family protein [Patescibacteria group bacterium]|nr:DedA family protein [Patescibacteria group bacterium]